MTNTMEKASQAFAFCYRSGHIGFGASVPQGTIKLYFGDEARLRDVVGGIARLSRADNKTLFVPGIPEADDDETASRAAWDFSEWIARRMKAKEVA